MPFAIEVERPAGRKPTAAGKPSIMFGGSRLGKAGKAASTISQSATWVPDSSFIGWLCVTAARQDGIIPPKEIRALKHGYKSLAQLEREINRIANTHIPD